MSPTIDGFHSNPYYPTTDLEGSSGSIFTDNSSLSSESGSFLAENDPQSAPQDSSGSWLSRAWGAVKTFFGVTETAVGVATATTTGWTGVGAAAGLGVAAHGVDTSIAGLRQMWSGEETRTALSQGVEYLTGSEQIGEITDAAAGILGTGGIGAAKIVAGMESVAIPAARQTVLWRYGDLPIGVLGATDAYGGIIIRRGLKGDALQRTLDHELVHRFLSVRDGFLAEQRARLGVAAYEQSQLFRFTEEALAEIYGSGSVREGILHPLVNDYDIKLGELLGEAAVAGTALGQALRLGHEVGE